jgi:hypothetical protein
MLEIKSIDDPLSPLTSLLGPPAKDSGSFTGVLEELIGADPDAGNEIDARSETNSPPDSSKNTSTQCLEPIKTSSTPEILTKSDYDSFQLSALPGLRRIVAQLACDSDGTKGQPALSPSPEKQFSSEAEPTAALSTKQEVEFGVSHLVSQLAPNRDYRISVAPDRVREFADPQNQSSVFERPSPDRRGWPEGPGEGYKMNLSPGLSGYGLPSAEAISPQKGDSDVARLVPQLPPANESTSEQSPVFPQLVPNKGQQIGVMPDGAPDTADIQNQKSAFERYGEGFMLYPSPAASRHPLPSGEGISRQSPRFSTPLHADVSAADPILVTNLLGPIPTGPEVHSQPANLTSEPTTVSASPSGDANQRRIPEKLNLAEFDVTHFEYKTETEPHLSPALQSAQMLQLMRTSLPTREIKPVKPASSFDTLMQNASSHDELSTRPAMLARPDEIQHVRLVFEPPPPPPVVRSVSMDIGDPESQVRVVIRERNGNLNVQFGSTNERLREDLQVAGPMLMRELQRNNPMSVTLDFSNFGSATDAEGQSRSQSRARKFLKPDADFADVVETAYLPGPSSEPKSL